MSHSAEQHAPACAEVNTNTTMRTATRCLARARARVKRSLALNSFALARPSIFVARRLRVSFFARVCAFLCVCVRVHARQSCANFQPLHKNRFKMRMPAFVPARAHIIWLGSFRSVARARCRRARDLHGRCGESIFAPERVALSRARLSHAHALN